MTNTIKIVSILTFQSEINFDPGYGDNYLLLINRQTFQKIAIAKCCDLYELRSDCEKLAINYLN